MITTNPFDPGRTQGVRRKSGQGPDGEDDKLHEECGVFGIYGHEDAAALTALGLHALQHRGQEAAGIVSFDGEMFHAHRALGLVGDNFNSASAIEKLKGPMAIGHVRYSTTGTPIARNIQPLVADFAFGGLAIAHNGNLTNATTVRTEMIRTGHLFQSTTDTEIVSHLIAISKATNLIDRISDALLQVEGAYSFVMLSRKKVIGVRDPLGVRPLVLGVLDGHYIVTSETCALDIVGAKYLRDIEPGEMIVLDDRGLTSLHPFPNQKRRFCVFEYIYFARPDSIVEGIPVYEARKRIGMELAKESPVPADVVVPVPDSGVPAAMGYSAAAGLPFELGIIRNHYVGRTFIEPADQIRHLGVKLKHSPNRAALAGKRVILVDDSIVRGTTSTKIVDMVRHAGAAEVHMRISSPPTTHSCFYGIDTPQREKLLASRHSVAEMAKIIGVDSLAFISIAGLYRAMGHTARTEDDPQFCDACFTGDYPTRLTDRAGGSSSRQLSLLEEVA